MCARLSAFVALLCVGCVAPRPYARTEYAGLHTADGVSPVLTMSGGPTWELGPASASLGVGVSYDAEEVYPAFSADSFVVLDEEGDETVMVMIDAALPEDGWQVFILTAWQKTW